MVTDNLLFKIAAVLGPMTYTLPGLCQNLSGREKCPQLWNEIWAENKKLGVRLVENFWCVSVV